MAQGGFRPKKFSKTMTGSIFIANLLYSIGGTYEISGSAGGVRHELALVRKLFLMLPDAEKMIEIDKPDTLQIRHADGTTIGRVETNHSEEEKTDQKQQAGSCSGVEVD